MRYLHDTSKEYSILFMSREVETLKESKENSKLFMPGHSERVPALPAFLINKGK